MTSVSHALWPAEGAVTQTEENNETMRLCGRKSAAFSWITFIIWSEKNGSKQTIELNEASKDRISQLMVSHTHKVQELRHKGRTMQNAG